MTRKLMISTLTIASLVMACTANPRKAPIRKSGGTGGSGAAAEETIELPKVKELVTSNEGCFQLESLVKELMVQSDRAFTVHLRDSDFLVKGEKDFKPWIELDKTGKEDPEEFATRANALIIKVKPPLVEFLNSNELMSSKMLFGLLDVRSQTDCKTITFADGKSFSITPGKVTPTREELQQQQRQQNQVQGQSNRRTNNSGTPMNQKLTTSRKANARLFLTGINGTNESRTYTIIGNRLHIAIFQPAGTLTACKGQIDTLIHKDEYVLNFSNKKKVFSITHRLAALLKATLQHPGNLEAAANKPGQKALSRQRGGNIGGGAGGLEVTPDDLTFYTRQIISGHLKSIACK